MMRVLHTYLVCAGLVSVVNVYYNYSTMCKNYWWCGGIDEYFYVVISWT